jgi:hypothetical protein
VAVGPGQDPTERNAVAVGHARAFQPLLAPIHQGTPGRLAATGRLGDRPVDGDLIEDETDDPVVGVEHDLFQAGEDTQTYPLVAAAADRRNRAAGIRDRFVRAAEPQDLQQLVEHDPAPVAAQRVGGIELRALGQQGGELVPQRLRQP